MKQWSLELKRRYNSYSFNQLSFRGHIPLNPLKLSLVLSCLPPEGTSLPLKEANKLVAFLEKVEEQRDYNKVQRKGSSYCATYESC